YEPHYTKLHCRQNLGVFSRTISETFARRGPDAVNRLGNYTVCADCHRESFTEPHSDEDRVQPARHSILVQSSDLPSTYGCAFFAYPRNVSMSDAAIHSGRAAITTAPAATRSSALRLCISGLASFVFNRFLMYIPSCRVRLLFFRLRTAKLGRG